MAVTVAADRERVDGLPHILCGRDLHDLDESCIDVDVDHRTMRGEEERDVALILRRWITRLRIAMAVGDGLVDRLLEKRREVIR